MPSESNTRSAKSRYKTNPNNIRNHAWGLEDTVALCYDLPDLFGIAPFHYWFVHLLKDMT
jgi:hypothetical protein